MKIFALLLVAVAVNALSIHPAVHEVVGENHESMDVHSLIDHLQSSFNNNANAFPTNANRPPAIPSQFTFNLKGTIYSQGRQIPYDYNNGNPTVNGQPLANIRDGFLKKLPLGPTVDFTKANPLAALYETPMGAATINYFDKNSNGFNTLKLSDRNFRLSLAIQVLSNDDPNLYGRSLAQDRELFFEFTVRNLSQS